MATSIIPLPAAGEPGIDFKTEPTSQVSSEEELLSSFDAVLQQVTGAIPIADPQPVDVAPETPTDVETIDDGLEPDTQVVIGTFLGDHTIAEFASEQVDEVLVSEPPPVIPEVPEEFSSEESVDELAARSVSKRVVPDQGTVPSQEVPPTLTIDPEAGSLVTPPTEPETLPAAVVEPVSIDRPVSTTPAAKEPVDKPVAVVQHGAGPEIAVAPAQALKAYAQAGTESPDAPAATAPPVESAERTAVEPQVEVALAIEANVASENAPENAPAEVIEATVVPQATPAVTTNSELDRKSPTRKLDPKTSGPPTDFEWKPTPKQDVEVTVPAPESKANSLTSGTPESALTADAPLLDTVTLPPEQTAVAVPVESELATPLGQAADPVESSAAVDSRPGLTTFVERRLPITARGNGRASRCRR